MDMPFSSATVAYGNIARLVDSAGPAGKAAAAPASGPQFSELVADSLQSVVEAGKTSDRMAVEMVNGNGNIVDMVTAIAETEVAIESLVAVRDRVISAYEEIMRMPI